MMAEIRKFRYRLIILLILCTGVQCIITKTKTLYKYDSHCWEKSEDYMELRFVNVIFRHGDRTVDQKNGETYPNDPHKDLDFYPHGNGQLTKVGKLKMYRLGRILRKLYDCFLEEAYYLPDVYARSTAFTRCKVSLQLILAGLYPPANIQIWNSQLLWQPVDLIYNPGAKDALLLPHFCTVYKQVYANVLRSQPAMTEIKKFNNLMEEISTYTGSNITTLEELWLLHQTLTIHSSLGLSLPEWSEHVFPQLLEATLTVMKLRHYNDELIKLNGGVLLYKMIEDMKAVINGTLHRKINIFSGHDLNVIGLLQALRIFDDKLPSYASSIMIELYEKNNEYFVKVLRFVGDPQQIIEVSIPGCDKHVLCPFDKFVELLSATTATGEDPTCQLENNDRPTYGFLDV